MATSSLLGPARKAGVIQYERCMMRKAQDEGLPPTNLLSIDESLFRYEQATRAWGPIGSKPILEKPKGQVKYRALYLTIGFDTRGGEAKPLIHGVLIPPRRTHKPLAERIQSYEIEPGEKMALRDRFDERSVNSMSNVMLKAELRSLGIRAADATAAAMKDTLLRVGRLGTRLGELRARTSGAQDKGGALTPAIGDARMFSEYLSQCLVTFLDGQGLWNPAGHECKLSADLGIRQCPDFGVLGYKPRLLDLTLQLDGAPSHQPHTATRSSPFHWYVTEQLGLKGVFFNPPYSPKFNPVEYANSFIKRYVRKFAPATDEQLITRIREAIGRITGDMIKNWFKLAGFMIPGEEEKRPEDPNLGIVDRCSIGPDAKFDKREHVACFDSEGKLKREKKRGRSRWSLYEEADPGTLTNMSVSGRKGVLPAKRIKVGGCDLPEEGKVRWTGLGPEPPGLERGTYDNLFQNDRGDQYAIDGIVAERMRDGRREFRVRWEGYGEGDDSWLADDDFTHGLGSLITDWKKRNKKRDELKALDASKPKPATRKPNRNPKVGDPVALLSPPEAKEPFYVGQVVADHGAEISVHWYDATKVDGTFTLLYEAGKGKALTAKPYVGRVPLESVIHVIASFTGKKGRIAPDELKFILELAARAKL